MMFLHPHADLPHCRQASPSARHRALEAGLQQGLLQGGQSLTLQRLWAHSLTFVSPFASTLLEVKFEAGVPRGHLHDLDTQLSAKARGEMTCGWRPAVAPTTGRSSMAQSLWIATPSHLTACAVARATAAPFAPWAVRKGRWHCPVQVVGALPMPCRGQRSLPPHLAVSP